MFIIRGGVLLSMTDDRARFVSGGKPAKNGVSWGGSSGWSAANENGRIKVVNGEVVGLPATPNGEVYQPMEAVQTRSVGSTNSEIICELHGASGDDGGNVGGYGLGVSAGDGAGSMALVADGVVVAEVGGGGGGGNAP